MVRSNPEYKNIPMHYGPKKSLPKDVDSPKIYHFMEIDYKEMELGVMALLGREEPKEFKDIY